ncbi:MAG: alpha-amylase family glycosyl hydrolase [Melioribacteraceae bacterium]|nr:cyclomaltodextrinase N-terminal domain-containing protein [Melioribacteraceae bacterium]MDD3558497.1 alpha-amylase family glycosyl hydrolase [Melioribacteraceae bacterium]
MIRKIVAIVVLFLSVNVLFSQELRVSKVEPPNWWSGMKYNSLQLMIYGENLIDVSLSSDNEQISVGKIYETESGKYLFVDIDLDENIQPEDYSFKISSTESEVDFTFPVFPSNKNEKNHKGFDNGDAIYLVMPDRFVNGDTSNDFVEGYVDKFQGNPTQERKGGDLQGIIDKLPYLKDLGFTTIWMNPVVENNTFRSYHGYAATDFYNVDPRLGNNELYKKIVDEAHNFDLKIIMDHVANHFSIDHPWTKSLPFDDWINGEIGNNPKANHHKMIFTDPYSDSLNIKQIEQGWFVDYMPDFNQSNQHVAKYIIQNTLWWCEFSGIDGIREDTYPYAQQDFMSDLNSVVLTEYTNFNIVGEVWTGDPVFLAGYQKNNPLRNDFDTNLPALTDFGLRDELRRFVRNESGLFKIYELFAKDYLYSNPDNLVTFVDNHDVERIMFNANGNVDRAKLAYFILLTSRGIPQIFYGSEIGMIENEDHGTLRAKFPGGFPGDERDAFTEEGRTDYENDIFDFMKTLLHIRLDHPAISQGKLKHFPPDNNIYIYFKYDKQNVYLLLVNGNETDETVDIDFVKEVFPKHKLVKVIFGEDENDRSANNYVHLPAMSAKIYKLSR